MSTQAINITYINSIDRPVSVSMEMKGESGYSGISGLSGFSGIPGFAGGAANMFYFDDSGTPPANFYFSFDDIDPTQASKIWINDSAIGGLNVENWLEILRGVGGVITISAYGDTSNYYVATLTDDVVDRGDYWEFTIEGLISSIGTVHSDGIYFISFERNGYSGFSGWSGSGISGWSGVSGFSGTSGYSGYDPSQAPLDHDWVLGNYSLISTANGSVTRDGDGFISTIVLPSRTLTFTRDVDGYISTISDGTRTWTFTRNASHQITAWTVV